MARMRAGWLSALERFSTGTNRLFTALSGALAFAIVIIVLQDVVRRYAFNDPSVWALDVCSFLLVYLFFLALAPALQRGSHVTVDLFNEILPTSLRRPVTLLGYGLIVIFGSVFFWQLLEAAREAFADDDLFPTATPMKVKYVWMVGPVGAAQFILTAVVLLVTAIRGDRPRARGPASGD